MSATATRMTTAHNFIGGYAAGSDSRRDGQAAGF